MNCQDFELVVLPLARNQLIAGAVRDLAHAHAVACVRCAVRLGEERALIAGMRAVVEEIVKEEAPVRLETELLRAFREHTAVPAAPATGGPLVLDGLMPRWALAAAAVILISLTAAAILRHIASSPEPTDVAQTIKQVPSVPPDRPHEPMPPKLKPVFDGGRKPAQGRATLRRPGLRDSSGTEVATHFFPLIDSDDFNSLESGHVVRLELPGSALNDLGLSIDVMTTEKTVTADVVIGPDGLAHAIRFIPPSNH